jgi:signal transduction histidine kinase
MSLQSRLSGARHFSAVIGPATLVLVLGVLAYTAINRVATYTAEVARTHQVRIALNDMLHDVVASESAVRGYILSGDTGFLAGFARAPAEIQRGIATLRASIHSEAQQRRVDALEPLIARKLALNADFVAQRQVGNVAAVEALVIGGAGKDAMDAVSLAIRELDEAAAAITAARVQEAQATAGRLTALVLVASLLAVLLALLTNFTLSRYLLSEERLAGELTERNAQLQEQAVELELQSDELQAQAAQLEESAAELEQAAEAREELLHAEQFARQAAEHANAAKSAFLAAMSHELRTPLNAIAGYVDLLDLGIHGPLLPGQRESLDRVRRNQQHLLQLISELLTYARIEAGRTEYARGPVHVGELLAELDPLIAPLVTGAGLLYSCQPVEPRLVACADRERVEQILLNLIGNAVKFTPPGGQVTVWGEMNGQSALLHVRDNGRGIAPEFRQKIFEPFTQIDRDRVERSQQGVGLGLAISRELAEGMGGSLDLVSEPGNGSIFTLALPLWVAETGAAATHGPLTPAGG